MLHSTLLIHSLYYWRYTDINTNYQKGTLFPVVDDISLLVPARIMLLYPLPIYLYLNNGFRSVISL